MHPLSSPRQTYLETGFYLHPEPILPMFCIQKALDRIPAVVNQEYDTGIEPFRRWNVGDPKKVQKIDHVHLCDKAFHLLATQPIVGEWVARITGAQMVQLWSTQLFIKPPGGESLGVVGWHTDRSYWPYWDGDVLTVWLALSDVPLEAGPVLYVEGSHRWLKDQTQGGDGFAQDLDMLETQLKQGGPEREWHKVPALLRVGGVAFHSADTLHASEPNTTDVPRLGLAINVRTDNAWITPGPHGFDWETYLTQPFVCPIIYKRRAGIEPLLKGEALEATHE